MRKTDRRSNSNFPRSPAALSKLVSIAGCVSARRVIVTMTWIRATISPAKGVDAMNWKSFRQARLTLPLFKLFKQVMPGLSDTEREALEAGDVWWDAQLFSGNPDWQQLLDTRAPQLTEAEQAFMDGPVETLCQMLDDWQITWTLHDLPQEAWRYIRENHFFGLIIPERYGGLGFSAYAHSQVIRKLSSRSLTAAVTVMVPNSLGPGELLMQFGTEAQREHYLPRLAKGQEVPAFGLTSPEAGSDAASMRDEGVVCRDMFEGEETLGIRLNWHKRFITLGPVATLLGLAFKLRDPDHLIGDTEDIGITLALVPTHLPGIEIGRRHIPSLQMFQNGPNFGRDVFIPIDYVIGGRDRVGQGWRMLMSALAAGRGISLPSQSAAAAALAARTSGAYARVRQQFDLPVAKFEGVQYRLARIASTAYVLDAGRKLTCAGLDEGRKLSVISAIMKAHSTYRMRDAINDAMDVHAGKAVIDGPLNYLGNAYRAIPVGITVEGANIMTRNLIIFGQGAIRCHPWLLAEMQAVDNPDPEAGLEAFDTAFWRHVSHSLANAWRAWARSWSGGLLAPSPNNVGKVRHHYRAIARYAACFALSADVALLTLGGSLKRKELLSARFGDILSELYLLTAVLKRWRDDNEQPEDLPVVAYAVESGLANIQQSFAEIFANLPNRPAAWLLRLIIQPLGRTRLGPSDKLVAACAELLTESCDTRDRLTEGLCLGYNDNEGLARLERAFDLVVKAESIERKLKEANQQGWRRGLESGVISTEEGDMMKAMEDAVAGVIEVDSFEAASLSPQ